MCWPDMSESDTSESSERTRNHSGRKLTWVEDDPAPRTHAGGVTGAGDCSLREVRGRTVRNRKRGLGKFGSKGAERGIPPAITDAVRAPAAR